MDNSLVVSVVMPLYNEEAYLDDCIQSLLKQDFPRNKMEWIFVDGMSTDRTMEILEYYQSKLSIIKILKNAKKIVPCAMNIGIEEAKGRYIIRLDAHSDYPPDYISKCVYYLEQTNAENVGGVLETKAEGFVGNAIAKVLSSPFGVGDSQFRTNGESGYVDTVPFGAFKREVFYRWGGYDERLVRNQDNEMNYRIRKNGGKIYLANDIHLTYHCRDSVKDLIKMALKNGKWNIITTKLCKGTMGLRHFIPLLFVMSLILMPILAAIFSFSWFGTVLWILFGVENLLYLALDAFFSWKLCESGKEFLLLLGLFPTFHITYGFGSIMGIFSLPKFKKTDKGSTGEQEEEID